MSVDLYITRADGREESVCVCGQRTGEDFIGAVAREHGFRILTGTYPVWADEGDLAQLLHELDVIRRMDAARLFASGLDLWNREALDRRWESVIAMLRALADETGWEVSFG